MSLNVSIHGIGGKEDEIDKSRYESELARLLGYYGLLWVTLESTFIHVIEQASI